MKNSNVTAVNNNKGQSESTKLENATVFRKENNLLRA